MYKACNHAEFRSEDILKNISGELRLYLSPFDISKFCTLFVQSSGVGAVKKRGNKKAVRKNDNAGDDESLYAGE